MDNNYDPIGVTKSRICMLIAKSEEVRKAIDYKGLDAAYPYDPNDYTSLIWNCIYPVLKDPDTITTSDTQIFVGIDSHPFNTDPSTEWLYGTIIIVNAMEDLRIEERYIRADLLEDGICAYTKPDYIAYCIKKALSAVPSKTWLGDIQFLECQEGSNTKSSHYGRTIRFKVRDINIGNRGI